MGGWVDFEMKNERSNVDFPLWRKKVDSSLWTYNGTTIPNWACQMWSIVNRFSDVSSKNNPKSNIKIKLAKNVFDGWVTVAKKGRKTPAFRLWFSDDLSLVLKETFLMSYMRDIEKRLRDDKGLDIEDEIPFWEFLDIEFDQINRTFIFTPYYTQKPSFPELFSRLIGSPSLKKIDDDTANKNKEKIYKQDWKPRDEYQTEIGAENVIYMLLDSKNKLFYVGEAKHLVKRLSQGHSKISKWDYYRYDVLPDSFENHRLEIERMQIRMFATLLKNSKGLKTMNLSKYKLVNDKIDK